MIVKKIPIFQGFTDFAAVKNLSNHRDELSENNLIFYDIETTGLSRKTSFVYLIGAVRSENGQWVLYQWLAGNESEEPLILKEFLEFLSDVKCTVHYNGNRFDQPYLEERLKKYGMDSPFEKIWSIDVYQLLKPCQNLFKLENMKQPEVEKFVGICDREYCDGGMCIRHYKSYVKKCDKRDAEVVLGHNYEDLLGLGKIFGLLVFCSLYEGNCNPIECSVRENDMILVFEIPGTAPVSVSCGTTEFYLTVSGNTGRLLVHLREGRLRQYYPNYKEYDYLLKEDTAIPKSLSCYMDKSLRRPAKPETCYTWFACDEDFQKNHKKQNQYLRHTLPAFLRNLK